MYANITPIIASRPLKWKAFENEILKLSFIKSKTLPDCSWLKTERIFDPRRQEATVYASLGF